MTERYLLGELDPADQDEFEEHVFDCQKCALDVHAGSTFVEQSKIVLAENSVSIPEPVQTWFDQKWFYWLRPVFAAPVLATLLAVIGYQNFVTYPHLREAMNRPQVLQWASVNVGTWGASGPVIETQPGKGFLLFVRIPPDGGYSQYTADLYDPGGKQEWTLTIPVAAITSSTPGTSPQEQWPVQVPGANWQAGTYTLAVRGTTASGESKEVGRTSFELQIQK